MAPACSYFLCNTTMGQKPLFRFPTRHPKRLEVWLNNCGNMTISHFSLEKLRNKYLCINHFNKKFIKNVGRRRTTLSKLAVPDHYKVDGTEAPSISKGSLQPAATAGIPGVTVECSTEMNTKARRRTRKVLIKAESGGTKACRLCLVMDSNLLAVDIQLESSMRRILGQSISFETGLPKYVCDECVSFLRSFQKFREKSLVTQTVLYKILKTAGQVTESEIKKLKQNNFNLVISTPPLPQEDIPSASHQEEEFCSCEIASVYVNEEPEIEMDEEEKTESENKDNDKSKDEDKSNVQIQLEQFESDNHFTESEIKKLNQKNLNLVSSTPPLPVMLVKVYPSSASHQVEEPSEIASVYVKEEPKSEMDVEEETESKNKDNDESKDEDKSNVQIQIEQFESETHVTETDIKKLNRMNSKLVSTSPPLPRDDIPSSASHQEVEPCEIASVNVKEEPESEIDVEEETEPKNEDEDKDNDESKDEDKSNVQIQIEQFESESEVLLKSHNPLEEHTNIKKEITLFEEEADMSEGFTESVPPSPLEEHTDIKKKISLPAEEADMSEGFTVSIPPNPLEEHTNIKKEITLFEEEADMSEGFTESVPPLLQRSRIKSKRKVQSESYIEIRQSENYGKGRFSETVPSEVLPLKRERNLKTYHRRKADAV